jgi:hypothetical protein
MSIWRRVRQYLCKHNWRPGIRNRYSRAEVRMPVAVCDVCGKVVELTLAAFYARFGRMMQQRQRNSCR